MMIGKKSRTCIILILAAALLGAAFSFYYSYAKKEKTKLKSLVDYYDNAAQSGQKWLVTLQQSNGALAYRGKENGTVSIIPYFSSITAAALLQRAPNLEYKDSAKEYFDWHFVHLNDGAPDINGIPDTIYDYTANVSDGIVQSETTEQKYDSTDSYAAVFLTALWEYYRQSGDAEYLLGHYKQITGVMGAMTATMDNDGLTYAKPNYQVKYLMDNAEVYKGISCSINLLKYVFMPAFPEVSEEYGSAKQMLSSLLDMKTRQEQAFRTVLWNESGHYYKTGIDSSGKALDFEGLTKFYPDAVGQLFPVVFGILSPESERARYIYNTFSGHFHWENMSHYENGDSDFYWGLLAYSGALMHDEERVHSYINYFMTKVAPDYEYPAYNADVAWVVLAASKMSGYYQDKMHKIDPLGIIKGF